MNTAQLMLFPQECARLNTAIETISEQRIPLTNNLNFVREIYTAMVSLPQGSVILAAAHGGNTSDEVCAWITECLRNGPDGQARGNPPAMSVIKTPLGENQRLQRKYLLDAYHGAVPLSRLAHTHEPQFQLQFGQSFLSQDRMQVVAGLIAGRPIDYYLLRDAHQLQRPGDVLWDAREHVRYIIQLAQISGRTHVLLGRMTTLWQWLDDSSIADAVTPCMLHPYDLEVPHDASEFADMLTAYDAVIPWCKGITLVGHIQEVNSVVWGSPQRVRKWVLNALTGAKARGMEELDWKCFWERKPTPAECTEAKAEFDLHWAHTKHQTMKPPVQTETVLVSANAVKPKRQSKPGRCNPKRRDVGFEAA